MSTGPFCAGSLGQALQELLELGRLELPDGPGGGFVPDIELSNVLARGRARLEKLRR